MTSYFIRNPAPYVCPNCNGTFSSGHYCVGTLEKFAVTNNIKYPEEKLTYYTYYKCTNCGKEDNLQFKKGIPAPQKTTCPKCECFTMVKVLR